MTDGMTAGDWQTIPILVSRLGVHSYEGGVNGTCYQCPFASAPLDRSGRVAAWGEISNDPTEAYFRCSLPGRDNVAVEWGEYAPCTEAEWSAAVLAAVARLQHQHEQIRDALLNAQGCRTCDMCPDCGHLAHGSANEIGHYDDCEIAAALARLDEQEQT